MEQLSQGARRPNVHAILPHLLMVVRDPSTMVGISRGLMEDRSLDIVRGVEEAKRYLHGFRGMSVSQVLCEDIMDDGTAEDVHRQLTDVLSHQAYFLVLGGASISLAGRGVMSVPKPGDPARIRTGFNHLADAHARSA